MAALSDYLENKLLDHVLRAATYTVPATVYLALFTSSTSDAGGGTEVTGGSYARQAVTFSAAAGGLCENSTALNFVNMPVATVTHCAVIDASTAGNFLFHGPLVASRTTQAGDTLTFAVGALDCTLA
jgi:hypothetical protein